MKTTYRFLGLLTVAALLTACASQGKVPSREAVEDYVAVAGLEEIKSIRYTRQLSQTYLNDHYMILSEHKDYYLAEFVRRCFELRDNTYITPDIRRDHQTIRARMDTIRGCRIKTLYNLNEGQVAELTSLGDAPGDTLE